LHFVSQLPTLSAIETIMEERYEIRGKIGQGGLGAVYRGYDLKMSREVAIKRISTVEEDPELSQESTSQLVKEAGALASLQHPNIVTVHDVGSDGDGPYVVMELIEGKTLDESIEHAPLTWQDFRELALQTQEALIAAQERNLIHSDLKPSNLMITWLPSGKFQVKIVDFGLASLAHSQSKQDLESIDVVFGSIFFMPPEQFERQPLDMRSDMYSIGCVYYQALAGRYPFDGATGNEVMESHLHHKVVPLRDVRAGIPVWASDWVMWHLNRYPQDRPESAREALSLFLQNDKVSTPPLSTGVPPATAGPPRARVRMPGETSSHEPTPTQPLGRETGPQTVPAPTPQPLTPPEGLKPSVHTTAVLIPDSPTPTAHRPPRAPRDPAHIAAATQIPIQQSGKSRKIILIGVAVIALLSAAGIIIHLSRASSTAQLVSQILTKAEASGATDVPVTGKSLDSLLAFLTSTDGDSLAPRICPALAKARATDATNVDVKIAEFVVNSSDLSARTRELLIAETLAPRANPSILPAMLTVATSSKDAQVAVSALQSIRPMIGDEHLDKMIRILTTGGSDAHVRDAAEANISEMLRRSPNPAQLVKALTDTRGTTYKPEILQALKRLTSFGEALPARNK
jgi:serine/threonine protein kinase